MTHRRDELLEHMHKMRNELNEAVNNGTLSVAHFDNVQKAVVAVNDTLPTEIGSDNDKDDEYEDLLVKKFQDLSRSWGRRLEGMMEDSQRRQKLRDIYSITGRRATEAIIG